ncbi:MAG TPA: hypothetical protein VN328_10195 [Thermodesulfovibrionales bacterium]|nr:hypothetical protein [Thermodesulfovibrionales bacterium]
MTRPEKRLLSLLNSPNKIQLFIDSLAYATETVHRSPLRVLRERTCQCFDGAVFAAAMLRRLGYRALILDLLPNKRDDDHVLALFCRDGHWGAVAKSNFVGLRFREAVYRTVRELVMSYFEQYYNLQREKTLRGFTLPLDLKTFDRFGWITRDDTQEMIAHRLDEIRRVHFLTKPMVSHLSLVDNRSCRSGLLGANRKGLYKPPRRKR